MNPNIPRLDTGTPPVAPTPPDSGQQSAAPEPQRVLPDDAMVIVPVRNMVLFPGMIVPVSIGRERSINAAQYAIKTERPVGILMQRNPEADSPTADDLAVMGTEAAILRYVTTPDGSHHIVCQGQQRFRVLGYLDGFDFMVARVERIAEAEAGDDSEIEARFFQLRERAVEALQLLPKVPQEMLQAVQEVESPGMLADLVAGYVDIKPAEKQELLEEVDLRTRLDRVIDMLAHRIEVLNLSRDIDQRTKASIGQREREFLLREQLKEIQKELGLAKDDKTADIERFNERLAKLKLSESAQKRVDEEMQKLSVLESGSPEYSLRAAPLLVDVNAD